MSYGCVSRTETPARALQVQRERAEQQRDHGAAIRAIERASETPVVDDEPSVVVEQQVTRVRVAAKQGIVGVAEEGTGEQGAHQRLSEPPTLVAGEGRGIGDLACVHALHDREPLRAAR